MHCVSAAKATRWGTTILHKGETEVESTPILFRKNSRAGSRFPPRVALAAFALQVKTTLRHFALTAVGQLGTRVHSDVVGDIGVKKMCAAPRFASDGVRPFSRCLFHGAGSSCSNESSTFVNLHALRNQVDFSSIHGIFIFF